MSTTPPAATAQRLLISFLLAAVVFEGWAIYGLSRRVSRMEARNGLGLAALTSPDDRAPDRPGDQGNHPDPRDRQADRGPGRDQDRPDQPPEGGKPNGEKPEGPEGQPGDLSGGEPRGRPEGGGPTLERLAAEEKYVKENLESYLSDAELDDATAAGLLAEIDRIFATRKADLERPLDQGEDPDTRTVRIEEDKARSTQVFTSLLGEEEARLFIDEVMRPPPGEHRPPPPGQALPPGQGDRERR